MFKLIIFFILNVVYLNISFAEETFKKISCSWENKKNIPCLEIEKNISNSSEFTKSIINKTVISRKTIEESGAIDLIDILKSIPDINITQSGPKGQQASMFMRGTGSNHVLVMINGIPINDQSTTQGLHDFGVDFIQTIQQIEIYPGSSATHFGTNAIGGAINIILTGDYNNSFSISSDKNKNYEFMGNKSFIYDNSSLNFKIGSVKNKTISARGNLTDEKDGVKNYTTNVNYENFIKSNLRLYNHLYLRQTKTEYDNSSVNQTGYKGDNKMGSFQIGLENFDQIKRNNYIFYYNIYDREYDERGTLDKYESEVLGLKYDLSKTFSKTLSYGVGSEYKYDWGYFDNNGSYEASTKGYTDNFSMYGNLGWNIFKNSNISLFTRIDKHKQTGENNSYKLNFEQNYNNAIFGISFMNGIRNPTLYEMYGTDNIGYSGNRNLKAETSNTYEVYSNLKINQNFKISLRTFKSNIKNNIEYVDNKYQNDNDGIDLNQSGLNFGVEYIAKNTDINFFSSLLSSKKENNNNQLRRPEKKYGLNISKKINNKYLGDIKFNINYNHYGKHLDTHSINFSTIEMDSTDLVDFKIIKQLNNNELYLIIHNLLGEIYQKPHGYNQDDRVIKIGYKY